MKKRQGSVTTASVAILVLILLVASMYLGLAAFTARKTAQGELFLGNADFAGALASFKDAEKFDKYLLRKNPRVIEGIAESYFGLDDLASSLEYYLRVTATAPDNAKAVYTLGMIYIKQKEFVKAGEQVKALESMGTYEAKEYAEKLSELLRENSLKGVFRDLYDRFAPNIPEIPRLNDRLDALKDRLTPNPDEKKADSERKRSIPDTSETEKEIDDGAGATI